MKRHIGGAGGAPQGASPALEHPLTWRNGIRLRRHAPNGHLDIHAVANIHSMLLAKTNRSARRAGGVR
jgi:hypothetical protein